MAKRKRTSELVALSYVVVLTVYAGGYTLTQPAADRVKPSARITGGVRAVALRDGTYPGVGTSQFGSVAVMVTIQHGKISACSITQVTTRFSGDRIGSLPAAVVARQSAAVDVVSGATGSSQAFVEAVQAALAQAST